MLSFAMVVFHSQLEARGWTRERITGQPEVILGDAGMGIDTPGETALWTKYGLSERWDLISARRSRASIGATRAGRADGGL